MSKLELILNKETYKPGEKIEGSLLLELKKDTKVRDVVINVYGNEHTHITRTHGSVKNQHTVTHTEDVEVIDESQSLIGQFDKTYQLDPYAKSKTTTLPAGQHNFKFSFQLPNDATPTYDGSNAEVNYEISAKVDIPWKFDIKTEQDLYLTPADALEETTTSLQVDEKSGSNVLPQILSPDINMTLYLNKKDLIRGQDVEGKIVITNNSGKAIRNILVDLYANEHAEAEGYTEDSTVMQKSWKIPVTYADLNYFEQTFKFSVPSDAMPTIEKTYFDIEWYLTVGLDVAKAKDLEVEVPVTVK
ncbi:MAG: arrestin family protein [Nanoarchaeota archaeon]|nr:arrestin family protein [Nanoarchaeota archaeon]